VSLAIGLPLLAVLFALWAVVRYVHRISLEARERAERVEEEQRPLAEPVGRRYVLGSPPSSHILKPSVQPLFDTFLIPLCGKAQDTNLFNDRTKFPDGRQKSHNVDTNMPQSGQLGYPLEFDLVALTIGFATASAEDIKNVLGALKIALYVGQNVQLLAATGSEFSPVIAITDGVSVDNLVPLRKRIGESDNFETIRTAIMKHVEEASEKGLWRTYMMRIAPQPYRLDSVTSFRVEASCDAGPLSGEVRMKVALRGIKYSPL
jgi:hypothetical protein